MKVYRYTLALIIAWSAALPVNAGAEGKASPGESDLVAKVYAAHACVLLPFNRSYVDVAVKEKRARKKVSNRCQAKEGKMNIFCQEEKAECTAVRLKIKE